MKTPTLSIVNCTIELAIPGESLVTSIIIPDGAAVYDSYLARNVYETGSVEDAKQFMNCLNELAYKTGDEFKIELLSSLWEIGNPPVVQDGFLVFQ
jgi:hypothetical protein